MSNSFPTTKAGRIINAARRQGLIPTNPAEAVDLPSVDGTGVERGVFTPAQNQERGAPALRRRGSGGDRATEFKSRCRQLNIKVVTLHSYRYAWAERAKMAVCPERLTQEALGHNSKAVHRAYAKRALMKIPSLEDYKQRAAEKVVAGA